MSALIDLIATQREVNGELERLLKEAVEQAQENDGGHTWERGVMGAYSSPTQWVDACIKWEEKP